MPDKPATFSRNWSNLCSNQFVPLFLANAILKLMLLLQSEDLIKCSIHSNLIESQLSFPKLLLYSWVVVYGIIEPIKDVKPCNPTNHCFRATIWWWDSMLRMHGKLYQSQFINQCFNEQQTLLFVLRVHTKAHQEPWVFPTFTLPKLMPPYNGRHAANDICKFIYLYENSFIFHSNFQSTTGQQLFR